MRRMTAVTVGALIVAVGGCRTATRVQEVPRVDLQVEETGNRGYLIGTPTAPRPWKTTRQMLESDVELPSFYKAKPSGKPVSLEGMVPSDADVAPPMSTPAVYDTYVVQKGDSLWSIAAKPEIYGRATHWRRLFDANRDLLKNPDQLKAGMTLKIPRDEGAGEVTYDDEGGTYQK